MKNIAGGEVVPRIVLLVFMAGCASTEMEKAARAHAAIKATAKAKTKVGGSVTLQQEQGNRVRVVGKISGLVPNAQMGFHVHQFGDCGNNGKNSGGHYNPLGQKHGGPHSGEDKRHQGDLGNLKADSKGRSKYEIVVSGRVDEFLGRAIIVHQGRDDMESQPTGNAGPRVGCGIIGIAK